MATYFEKPPYAFCWRHSSVKPPVPMVDGMPAMMVPHGPAQLTLLFQLMAWLNGWCAMILQRFSESWWLNDVVQPGATVDGWTMVEPWRWTMALNHPTMDFNHGTMSIRTPRCGRASLPPDNRLPSDRGSQRPSRQWNTSQARSACGAPREFPDPITGTQGIDMPITSQQLD